jgi:hypothetical protein
MKKKTGTSAGIPKDMRSPISNGGPMTQVSSFLLVHFAIPSPERMMAVVLLSFCDLCDTGVLSCGMLGVGFDGSIV